MVQVHLLLPGRFLLIVVLTIPLYASSAVGIRKQLYDSHTGVREYEIVCLNSSMVEHAAVNRKVLGSSPN